MNFHLLWPIHSAESLFVLPQNWSLSSHTLHFNLQSSSKRMQSVEGVQQEVPSVRERVKMIYYWKAWQGRHKERRNGLKCESRSCVRWESVFGRTWDITNKFQWHHELRCLLQLQTKENIDDEKFTISLSLDPFQFPSITANWTC